MEQAYLYPVRLFFVYLLEDVMRVVIVMDSFKGSLSSLEAGRAAQLGVLEAYPDAQTLVLPFADGGEGTARALVHSLGGELVSAEVTGPLGERVRGAYGITADKTAVMELAECAGLTLVPEKRRNPLLTSTVGLGEMILDALERGCRDFIIGIGGSATNDLGAGMLGALGVRFIDERGGDVPPCGGELGRVAGIETGGLDERIAHCRFRVACDVSNPLLGEHGCARVFSPQKGADSEAVEVLEKNAVGFSKAVKDCLGADKSRCPGSGAAGGLGYGFISFLPAVLESGADIVCSALDLEKKLEWADVLITGEGRIDAQSAMGKGPAAIAARAKEKGAVTLAFCGSTGEGAGVCNERGIDAIFPIIRRPCSLHDAMDARTAAESLRAQVGQAFRLIRAFEIDGTRGV